MRSLCALIIFTFASLERHAAAADSTREELIKYLTETGRDLTRYERPTREVSSKSTVTFEGEKLCVKTEWYSKGAVSYTTFVRVGLKDLDPNRTNIATYTDKSLEIMTTGGRSLIEQWSFVDGKWVREKTDRINHILNHDEDKKLLLRMESPLQRLIVLSGGKPTISYIKNASGKIVGSFDGKYVKDAKATIVGSFDGRYIKDASAKIVGSEDGKYIKDASAKIIGSVDFPYIKDAKAKIVGSYEIDGHHAGGLLLLLR